MSAIHEKSSPQAMPFLQILWKGYDDFCSAFGIITQRAILRFEKRDWQGMRRDTVERLDLYPKIVAETADTLIKALQSSVYQPDLWAQVKGHYCRECRQRCDPELPKTFYNSVHRRLFVTAGVDLSLTFAAQEAPELPNADPELFFSINCHGITTETILTTLSRYRFQTPFTDMAEDARLCASKIGSLLDAIGIQPDSFRIEMLKAPFFRGMSAYLVGWITWQDSHRPLVLVLDNDPDGIRVDAVLTTPEELRVLFSFSRAYFHVKTTCPSAIVSFLKQLMPEKRIAEIYIGLGYHKHGKTELYRDLLKHQQLCSQDRFDFSPGKHGMVMITFNMPDDDLIYKLIRDRFDRPKQTTAKQVMEKYDYVFKHDRAGRLVDVQTFENLELEECCFTPQLLSEIVTQATQAATVREGRIILHHAYVERRVTPLDIFLKQADADSAKAMVVDYGQAIKDLALINVFPGDMLLKNFGVTRLGRVVFYDYDELCPLLDCTFRKLPVARDYEDELSAEPWFMVGEHDVFPEEFTAFLGLSAALRQVFLTHHGDLLETEFWQQTQDHIRSGTWRHVRPYGPAQRLRHG